PPACRAAAQGYPLGGSRPPVRVGRYLDRGRCPGGEASRNSAGGCAARRRSAPRQSERCAIFRCPARLRLTRRNRRPPSPAPSAASAALVPRRGQPAASLLCVGLRNGSRLSSRVKPPKPVLARRCPSGPLPRVLGARTICRAIFLCSPPSRQY